MPREVLNPATVAPPIGDYAQAVRAGSLLFVAGQLALDRSGRLVGAGDFAAQARQALENLAAIVAAAGATLDDVVKLNIYLTDMNDRPTFAAVRREFFRRDFPASTLVEVTKLALPEAKIELEAVVLLPG